MQKIKDWDKKESKTATDPVAIHSEYRTIINKNIKLKIYKIPRKYFNTNLPFKSGYSRRW